jgi:hypothetical protein
MWGFYYVNTTSVFLVTAKRGVRSLRYLCRLCLALLTKDKELRTCYTENAATQSHQPFTTFSKEFQLTLKTPTPCVRSMTRPDDEAAISQSLFNSPTNSARNLSRTEELTISRKDD